MKELERFIKSNFEIDDSKEVKTIASLFEPLNVKKGDFLLMAGNQCNEMSFVQSGFMRMFSITDGKEITQWISSKGEFSVDLSGFFFEAPSRWNIQALVDTELFTISGANYNKIVDLVSGWREIEKLFLVRCFTTMEDRIHSHLSMSALERYNYFYEYNKELFNQVPIKYIASMLGMSPETMSRIRLNQSKAIS